MHQPARSCRGPLTRRGFLKLGSLALGAFSSSHVLPWKLQAATTATTAADPSVIFIWLPGGPPHMETYDMKPDAPAEYRGDFRPIRTNVPGIDVCEYLPMHARVADKFTIIRSIAHTFADHGGGHKRFLTGRDPLQPVGFVNDYPMVGSMVAKVRKERAPWRAELHLRHRRRPAADRRLQLRLGLPRARRRTRSRSPAIRAGRTSRSRTSPPPQEQVAKMRDRNDLLGQLDHTPAGLDPTAGRATSTGSATEAMHLLTSDACPQGVRPDARAAAAARALRHAPLRPARLLARRLVEAGASFVTMVMENPTPPGQTMPKDVHLQLGLARRQLPHLQRRPLCASRSTTGR